MSIELLKKHIKEADMVLIGLGEEFECNDFLNNIHPYNQVKRHFEEQDAIWSKPYLQQFFLQKNDKLNIALNNLMKLVQNKNYYIVSTCMHQIEKKVGFPEERMVTPCGSYLIMQCETCNELFTTPDSFKDEMNRYLEEYIDNNFFVSKEIPQCHCTKCGGKAVFNSLFLEAYNEKGYLNEWERYTKWLQGTLNKKVCILEMGVSFQYPTVIRFPFEKAAFFNQKAHLIRVHHSLYQITEELKSRSSAIKENAIELLNKM